ncbi:MAG TPA: hypothetical protein VNF73_16820 [Candidatus Saccharimonadales bacterium]|nr:hypothetical protein [Candidatus Saccharimonadales bacterium]
MSRLRVPAHTGSVAALRSLALALLTVALLLPPSVRAQAATGSVPAGTRPAIVILIDGLCTSLTQGASVPASFDTPGGLADRLRSNGWPPASILAFSYRGGSIDSAGNWVPNAYTCDDTRLQGIRHDAATLDDMIHQWLNRHPGTDVDLVGYSQGGLVALAYLAQLADADAWSLPSDGRLATVVTLDSPLGGLPFVDQLCAIAPGTCGGSPVAGSTSLGDMSEVWGTSNAYPAGATRSVEELFGGSRTNQELAVEAARDHGIATLAIGNMRDWAYDPTLSDSGPLSFRDTQWLIDDGSGAGVMARVIDSGTASCPSGGGPNEALLCNHPRVLSDPAVEQAIVDLFAGGVPSLSATCPPGAGNCLAAPPRQAMSIASAITAGVVPSGGSFRTGLLTVSKGSRATVRFTMSPALAGARVEIWSRTRTGTYRRLTSRLADAHGTVRYYTPAVTGWTAFQARFVGDGAYLPVVSLARVVTVR